MTAYVGLGDFSGWRFTLTPATNAAGSPGFTRETQTPRHGWKLDMTRSMANATRLGATAIAAAWRADLEAGHPPADWVEAAWLAQWLAKGLIREAA